MKLIKQVKEKFWRNGFKAIDMTRFNLGFDIMLEDRYKVRVSDSIPDKISDNIDIYAIITPNGIIYCKRLNDNMILVERQVTKLLDKTLLNRSGDYDKTTQRSR